jgi:ATP-binding cassette, subfamily C (CFTR/MRP), member 1
LSGHDLNVAVIFSSLQLFNVRKSSFSFLKYNFTFNLQIIRAPLTLLPLILSSLSDALVALGRISQFLVAEDLPEPYLIDTNLHVAVQVDADFVWETVLATGDGEKGKILKGHKSKRILKGKTSSLPMTTADLEKEVLKDVRKNDQETPFELKNLKMSVPKGAFVGIVGRVGSGKV